MFEGMDVAALVLALAVLHGFVLVVFVQQPITGMLIRGNERDFVVHGLTNETVTSRGMPFLREFRFDV